jgi:hypothetical protein
VTITRTHERIAVIVPNSLLGKSLAAQFTFNYLMHDLWWVPSTRNSTRNLTPCKKPRRVLNRDPLCDASRDARCCVCDKNVSPLCSRPPHRSSSFFRSVRWNTRERERERERGEGIGRGWEWRHTPDIYRGQDQDHAASASSSSHMGADRNLADHTADQVLIGPGFFLCVFLGGELLSTLLRIRIDNAALHKILSNRQPEPGVQSRE